MAVTENKMSQSLDQNADGQFFRRVFDMTWDDWNSGVFSAFYYVGQSLANDSNFTAFSTSEWEQAMFISDLRLVPTNSQTNIKVSVLYSSRFTNTAAKERPNEKASLELEFDYQTQLEFIDNELYPIQEFRQDNLANDSTTPLLYGNWRATAKGGRLISSLDSAAPTLQYYKPTATLRVTVYSSQLLWDIVKDSVGKISRDNTFILTLIGRVNNVKGWDVEIAGVSDRHKWICVSCPISLVRKDSWRYDFLFVYKLDEMINWNIQYMNDSAVSINSGLYDDRDFDTIFNSLLTKQTQTERIEGTR